MRRASAFDRRFSSALGVPTGKLGRLPIYQWDDGVWLQVASKGMRRADVQREDIYRQARVYGFPWVVRVTGVHFVCGVRYEVTNCHGEREELAFVSVAAYKCEGSDYHG